VVRSASASARPLAPGLRCATCAAGPRPTVLEGQAIAAGRVVELHALRVEPVGVESTTEPLSCALVVLVRGVLDHGQKVLVTMDAAAVLGWAGPGGRRADGSRASPSSPVGRRADPRSCRSRVPGFVARWA